MCTCLWIISSTIWNLAYDGTNVTDPSITIVNDAPGRHSYPAILTASPYVFNSLKRLLLIVFVPTRTIGLSKHAPIAVPSNLL